MPAKPVIIFDLDGTLIDSAPAIAASVNAMLAALGRAPLPVDQVRRFMGDGVEPVVDRALAVADTTPPADRDAALRLFLEHHDAHGAEGIVKFPGADDLLVNLAADGFALALCTNKMERLTTPLLAHLGWSDRFAAVICGDTLNVRKPDPRPLRLAIERSGRGTAIYVGDTHVDVATSEAAGIPLIFVDHGHRDPVLDLFGHSLATGLVAVSATINSIRHGS